MKEEKNHVGRPTNEEVKVRKKKKLVKATSILILFIMMIIGITMLVKNVNIVKMNAAVALSDSSVSIKYPITFKDTPSFKVSFSRIGSRVKKIEVQLFANDSFNTKDTYYFGNGVCRPKSGSNSCNLTVYDPKWRLPVSNYMYVKIITYDSSLGAKDSVLWRGYYMIYSKDFIGDGSKFELSEKIKSEYTSLGKKGVATKKTTTKNSAKTGLKLNCPESAKVNKEFTCTTNAKGVKISVSKTNLAKGYNTSFTTTANDKTKQSKYTKTGTVTVKAELSGYKSVEKKVKIVSSATTKNSALNGKCSAKLSAIGNYKMQYTTSCTGNAKVTNIAYQVINPSNNAAITKLINRGSGWGAYKAGTSTIGFASDRKGKKIRVRVYYDTNASSKSTSHYQDAYEILK